MREGCPDVFETTPSDKPTCLRCLRYEVPDNPAVGEMPMIKPEEHVVVLRMSLLTH